MSRVLRTSCTRDCPDACGLLATVEDGADGTPARVTRLAGDPHHPVTRGFLCYRVGTHYLARHASPERLVTPLVKRGGRFVPLAWPRAIDLAVTRLRRILDESGGAALLHVQGGGSLGILKNLNKLAFRALGATETRGDVCDGAGTFANEADFGAADANDLEDVVNARAIVLWGKNVAAGSPHVAPLLGEARRRGAEIWLIDPLPHRSRAFSGRFLQPRPGGDAALALGAARAILDEHAQHRDLREWADGVDAFYALLRTRTAGEWAAEADVAEADVRALARLFLDRAPVTTLLGWGLQRRVNGATQVRAIDALHALSGNLGRPGASASFTTPRRRPFDLSAVEALAGNVPRTLSVARLGAEILGAEAPPIRAVVVDNMNPVATNPESETTRLALESREFVMVLDAFLTDTARAADLVLPVTTMLEEADLVGSYGHHYVSATRPVVERPGGTRSDLEIYQELARRLGVGQVLEGDVERWRARLARPLLARGLDLVALEAAAHHDPNAPHVAWRDLRFATPSGRYRFLDAYLGAPAHDAEYPLALHGLSTGRWQASQLTDADEEREGPLTVTCHPAAAGGVADGGRARLESRLGALEVVVRHDADYRRDTVYVPRARSHRLGRCVNALVRARLTDFGEGAAYYDEGVRIAPLDGADGSSDSNGGTT